jgi:hypothetical protein
MKKKKSKLAYEAPELTVTKVKMRTANNVQTTPNITDDANGTLTQTNL